MKLYEQYPGLLYSRGKLRDSHLPELLAGGYAVIALAPPTLNSTLANEITHYYHIPVPDGRLTEKVKDKFVWATSVAIANIREDRPVIVHCNAGRNRAGLLSALIVRRLTGISGEEALFYVRSIRPRAIANPEFEAWLMSLPAPPVGVMVV